MLLCYGNKYKKEHSSYPSPLKEGLDRLFRVYSMVMYSLQFTCGGRRKVYKGRFLSTQLNWQNAT
jgi:hypothetical protein